MGVKEIAEIIGCMPIDIVFVRRVREFEVLVELRSCVMFSCHLVSGYCERYFGWVK